MGVDAEAHIRESKELWHSLREVRGLNVAVAFSFDSSFYPPDPTRKVVPGDSRGKCGAAPARRRRRLWTMPGRDTKKERDLRISEQSKAAHGALDQTVTATGKPWAIVNQQLLSVGDHVLGFEITAIRSRQVEFLKEGVTVPVTMPD